MYPVGHVVLGCGVVWAAARVATSRAAANPSAETLRPSATQRFWRQIDYRWAALGALLPDIIDKPLTWSEIVGSHTGGHWYGHALLVYVVLLVVGLIVARRGNFELVLLAIGGFSHIAIDSTTHVPRSVLWPLLTLPVSHNPTVVGATNIAGEFFGSIAVLWYFAKSYRAGRLSAVLRTGDV